MSWVDRIEFKKETCKNQYGETSVLEENVISLYVVMTRKCTTNCRFCEYHAGKSELNLELFKKRYEELSNSCFISTVHFTGGEPSLELEKVKEICKIVKGINSFTKTSMNTNGSRLKNLEGIDLLDNIALSRHHYTDEKNKEIFQGKICTNEDIKNFKEKDKLHLSCNLIKGYIDNRAELKRYLDTYGEIGVRDFGLVSLMGINQYSKDNYVDFDNISIEEIENLSKVRYFCQEEKGCLLCKCDNYLYTTSNLQLISIYHRHAIQSNKKADMLVYENNHIKQGFKGEILI